MHIVFLNPQGNFDHADSLWTMHPDFGGQLIYVKELAIHLAKLGHKIDIITRKVDDKSFPLFKDNVDYYEGEDVRILRIACGEKKFLPKEELWECLDEWTDNIIKFYKEEGSLFDFMTGHYGDGGLACAMIKKKTGIKFSFTGHSLGAQKFDKLNDNFRNFDFLESKYNFTKRIFGELSAIYNSDIIFVSTNQEKEEQYKHILYKNKFLSGNPLFKVAPPGVNINNFAPLIGNNLSRDTVDKIDSIINRDIDPSRKELPFLILASRIDDKKNHIGLIKAYANNKDLQKKANVLISLRGIENAFEDYSKLKPNEIMILDHIMSYINDYNLKGKVSFLSINSQSELADSYRYFSKFNSIFVLTAYYEPFGLAPIEAMATGLPAAVTMYGGPKEVLMENGEEFGALLDIHNEESIVKGINKILDHHEYYVAQGKKRVASKYTWTQTAKTYLEGIKETLDSSKEEYYEIPKYFFTKDYNDLDLEYIKKIYKRGE